MSMQKRAIVTSAALTLMASLGVALPAIAGEVISQRSTSPSGTVQADPNRPGATSDPANLDVPRDQRDAPPAAGGDSNNMMMQQSDTIRQRTTDGLNQADPNRPDATSDPANLDVPRDQRDAPPAAGGDANTTIERNSTQQRGTTTIERQTTGESPLYRDTVPNATPTAPSGAPTLQRDGGTTIQRNTTQRETTIQRTTPQTTPTTGGSVQSTPTTTTGDDSTFNQQVQPVRGLW